MHIQLILLSGEKSEHHIDRNTFIIGRSPKCDIVIAHEGMSRQHCQIEVDAGEVFITDLGSTNGVLIDGEKIEPHKRTPYATYLTLAFGAVQSLHLRIDEPTNTTTNMMMKPVMTKSNHTVMTKTKTLPEPNKSTPLPEKIKPKAKPPSKMKSIVVNLTAVLIFAAAIWWYMQNSENGGGEESVSDEETTEQDF
jgi:pSer/pThr/pTyr-binding forkhead associated (FHA) protein